MDIGVEPDRAFYTGVIIKMWSSCALRDHLYFRKPGGQRMSDYLHGHVDVIDIRTVYGWVNTPATVTISVNGKQVGEAQLAEPRQDARDAGYPDARAFVYSLIRHLKPGENLVQVAFPDGNLVSGGTAVVHFDHDQVVDDHWSKQYLSPEQLVTRWWHCDRIVSHINMRVCGEYLPGPSHGLYRWLLKEYGPLPRQKGVSVGCGDGRKEMDVLESGIVREFDLYELSTAAIAAGRDAAAQSGLQDRMHFHHGDALGHVGPYDLVFWNNSLHHMSDVGSALSWSKDVLRPDGLLIMDEYVGPTRWQYPQWVLNENTAYRKSLPPAYKVNPFDRTQILADAVENPAVDALIEMDPSEAADSSNILPELNKKFPKAEIKLTGGIIYSLGINDILHNFYQDVSEIDRMLQWDDRLLMRGATLYAVAVARK
jgi:SAM-dependent methyltransferase